MVFSPAAPLGARSWAEAAELLGRDVGRLGADGATAPVAEEIAAAEERFGAWLVEDDLRVHGVRDAEADLEREVRFDESGDDGAIGPLRGKDEVHAGGAAFLRDAPDQPLELLLL